VREEWRINGDVSMEGVNEANQLSWQAVADGLMSMASGLAKERGKY
jgi:hypothetical protein